MKNGPDAHPGRFLCILGTYGLPTHFGHERPAQFRAGENEKTGDISMKFTKATLVASAAALSLGLAACDSPAENEMEAEAETMEDNRDAMVNDMEATGEITDEQADAMDDQTDAMEESMEEEADSMDTP